MPACGQGPLGCTSRTRRHDIEAWARASARLWCEALDQVVKPFADLLGTRSYLLRPVREPALAAVVAA